MLPGMEMLACPNLAVSPQVMQHIVQVESGANPFAIGVVGGKLARQPHNMEEALATARMLESKGYNFSVGIAQINRANLGRYGLDSYRKAFNPCDNLAAGAQILARCLDGAHGDWGKAFSCYYSGNFTTGFRDGYVQKVYASMNRDAEAGHASAIPVTTTAPAPPTDPQTTAVATSPGTGTLRPLVVYSSDNASYRVALRSVALDAAAAALAPLVVPATHGNTRGAAPDSASTVTAMADHSTAMAVTDTPQPGTVSLPPAVASTRRASPPDLARPAARDIFEPQVRGPADPAVASATAGQGVADPRSDGADLRLEHRDAAFVF